MTTQMEDAAAQGMTYARFFPSDWRTGCLVLNLEEEGLYIRICAYMYDTGKPMRDDYAFCASILRVQPQKFRKVLDSLIAKGKIIRAQGYLVNERVRDEIDRFRMEYAARATAAKKREEARRQRMLEQIEEAKRLAAAEPPPHQPPGQPPHQPPPGRQGGGTPGSGVGGSKKLNEINGTGTQLWHGSTTNPEARIQNPEILQQQGHSPDRGGGHLDSLNGTANDMAAFISKHAFVEHMDARRMLETNVKTFSSDVMMEAYSVTLANMGTQVISAPYKYLIETARRMKGKAKEGGAHKHQPEGPSVRDRAKRFAEDAAAKIDAEKARRA